MSNHSQECGFIEMLYLYPLIIVQYKAKPLCCCKDQVFCGVGKFALESHSWTG